MRESAIRSFDGTRVVYRVGGSGDRWLVFANGYGGTFCVWDDLVARLDGRCRVLVWDYRGLHRSEVPADRGLLRVEDHCRDLDLIREAEGVDRAVLAGWSVGVQVALEQYRRNPDSVDGLVLINGAHGRVLQRSAGSRASRVGLPVLLRGLRSAAPVLSPGVLPPLRAAVSRPWSGVLLRRLGLFNGESAALAESARAILRIDYRVYTHMILLADEHDTDDLLPRIDVPTMVIAGDRDAITSTALARSAADRIPGCLYREVAGATHYGVMEFPDQYAAHVRELLDRV